MKIIIIIFAFSLIFSEIYSYGNEYDLKSGVAQSISVTAGEIYYAYIEVTHGQDVNIELSMEYFYHKDSPFTTLHVYEYASRSEKRDSSAFYHNEISLQKNIKNYKLILSGNYNLENVLVEYMGLKFISSEDISDLSITITVSGKTTGEKVIPYFVIVVMVIILIYIVCIIGITCFFKHCCDQSPPRPKPVVPPTYTPLQPQPQTLYGYPPNTPQNQQYYPPVQQQGYP